MSVHSCSALCRNYCCGPVSTLANHHTAQWLLCNITTASGVSTHLPMSRCARWTHCFPPLQSLRLLIQCRGPGAPPCLFWPLDGCPQPGSVCSDTAADINRWQLDVYSLSFAAIYLQATYVTHAFVTKAKSNKQFLKVKNMMTQHSEIRGCKGDRRNATWVHKQQEQQRLMWCFARCQAVELRQAASTAQPGSPAEPVSPQRIAEYV